MIGLRRGDRVFWVNQYGYTRTGIFVRRRGDRVSVREQICFIPHIVLTRSLHRSNLFYCLEDAINFGQAIAQQNATDVGLTQEGGN